MRTLSLVLVALAFPLAAGCGDDAEGEAGGEIDAVATTTHVADLVRNVGDERVAVHGILPTGADPHDFEPRPSDAAALSEADVVFRSGGDLDEWLGELIESAGGESAEVTLLDSVRAMEGEGGE